MALTAGKAARLNSISRTALLYYDEIGLVKPSARSGSGYRLYSQEDLQRLQTVIAYRDAGISLEDISRLLSGPGNMLGVILLKRLNELNREIVEVKKQQAAVIGIIQGISLEEASDCKRSWRAILEEAGITGEKAEQLHTLFEEHSPQLHTSFLQALGFDENEIKLIRQHYNHN